MKTITITLIPGEPPKIEAKGFRGRECLSATRPYEQALGGKIQSRTETAEMRLAVGRKEQIKQRGE